MSEPPSDTRLPEIAPEQLSALQTTVLERLKKGRGRIPTPYKVWLHSPHLAQHLQELGTFLAKQTSLTRCESEIVILTAAAHWHSDYVFSVHAREARAAGLPDGLIEAISQGGSADIHDLPRGRTVFELARSLADSQPPSDELFNRAVRDLGHAGLAELLALYGYFTCVSLAMKSYRVPAAG